MSNYTKTTDFAAKDSLPSGDSNKIIRGSEFETEFDDIAIAVNSKSDIANPTFTGTVTIPTLSVTGTSADINFSDNSKAIFGDDADLEISHGTSGTLVNHVGTSGVLVLNSDGSGVSIYSNDVTALMAQFVAGGASRLFFNASQKLATTNTGIDVNGSITSDGIDTGIYAVESGVVKITNAGNPRVELLHPTNSTDTYLESTSAGSIELRADINNEGAGTYILGEIDGYTTFRSYTGGDFALYENTGSDVKLFWDASTERLGIGNSSPTTALDVTGTVTADGLTVDGDAKITSAAPKLTFVESDTTDLNTRLRIAGGSFQYHTANDAEDTFTRRLQIDNSTGDISFYEDTGTTSKLFWDASAESLGIGNSAPQAGVHVTQDATQLILAGAVGSNDKFIAFDVDLVADVDTHFITVDQADALAFGEKINDNDRVIENEWMRITNSGQVGIGTDAPAETLHVAGSIRIGVTGASELYTNTSELRLGVDKNNDNDISNITFYANDSEKARMDKDGHFIVPNGVTLGVAVDAYAEANTLDDYEEGTFTFTLRDATSGGNVSSSTVLGTYTKVGRLVTCSFNASLSNIDTTGMTGTNTLFMDLPFVTNSSCEDVGTLVYHGLDTGSIDASLYNVVPDGINGALAACHFRAYGNDTSDVVLKVQDITSGITDFVRFTYTYQAA
jgi:hypothetical protein